MEKACGGGWRRVGVGEGSGVEVGVQYAAVQRWTRGRACVCVCVSRCLLEEKQKATERLTSIILLLSNRRLPARKERRLDRGR